MPAMVFRSKVDAWLRVVSWAGAVVSLAVTVVLAARGDRAALWLTPALVLAAALPLWVLRTTDYTISATELYIRSGPFRWNVLLADIHSVTPTRSPVSSPALSLDRLRIEYARTLAVMVSPDDKDGFLRELCARAPGASARPARRR